MPFERYKAFGMIFPRSANHPTSLTYPLGSFSQEFALQNVFNVVEYPVRKQNAYAGRIARATRVTFGEPKNDAQHS